MKQTKLNSTSSSTSVQSLPISSVCTLRLGYLPPSLIETADTSSPSRTALSRSSTSFAAPAGLPLISPVSPHLSCDGRSHFSSSTASRFRSSLESQRQLTCRTRALRVVKNSRTPGTEMSRVVWTEPSEGRSQWPAVFVGS